MLQSQRQQIILKLLDQKESIAISELLPLMDVTEMTVRRDLIQLEEKGLLERIRGGATKIQRIDTENLFTQKNIKNKEEKAAIGRTTVELLDENDTVFINSGTTVLQVALQLKNLSMKLVTNNPKLTMIEYGEKVSLVILGGEFRKESQSIIGDSAMNMLSQMHATKCIIGVDGLSIKHGLTNSAYGETTINRKMIEQSRGKVIVVADHTKIGKVGPFVIAPIEKVDILVTTDGIPEAYLEQLKSIGIQVVIARFEPR